MTAPAPPAPTATARAGARYLADTNVYIVAANTPAFAADFAHFLATYGPIAVSTVVVSEVLFGEPDVSRHAARARAMAAGVPLATPTARDWLTAARAVAALGGDKVTKARSFWNDALIAAQCARLGLTLVTANTQDYQRLQAHIPVQFVAPFPR